MMMTLLLAGALLGSPQDDALVDAMMTGCRGHRPSAAMLDELLRMESAAGFPASVRGLMVAAACNESGFEPGARGDYVARGAGVREPTSYGLLQFQAWAKRGIRQQGADEGPQARLESKRAVLGCPCGAAGAVGAPCLRIHCRGRHLASCSPDRYPRAQVCPVAHPQRSPAVRQA